MQSLAISSLFQGALLAACIAYGTKEFIESRNGPCTTDQAVDTVFGNVTPCDSFSETYAEARAKFKSAAINAGAEMFTREIYQNFTTDIAYLPGEGSEDLVIHVSGVHGVEGFAGSAIQIAYLNTCQTNKRKPRPSLLMVHVVNPFGMAHFRRFNENNVDLNRNGNHDFTRLIARDPNLSRYVDFDAVFNPTKPFCFGFLLNVIPLILKVGMSSLKTAMVTGQYFKPTGIFFGGTKVEASNQKLFNFIQDFVTRHPFEGKTTWVSVHTGLGKFGIDTLLFPIESTSMAPAFSKVFVDSLVPSVTGGDDVSAGYSNAVGTTEEFMRTLFPKDDDWLVVQEFGTLPSIFVGRAIILENMYYQHFNRVSMIARDAFYCRNSKWRREIITRGLRLLKQAMER